MSLQIMEEQAFGTDVIKARSILRTTSLGKDAILFPRGFSSAKYALLVATYKINVEHSLKLFKRTILYVLSGLHLQRSV